MRILILAALAAAPAGSVVPSEPAPAPAAPVAAAAPAAFPAPVTFPAPVAFPTPSAAPAAGAPERADCRRPNFRQTEGPERPPANRLGELPAGNLVLAVYNEVEGCIEPVVVRYGTPGGGFAPEQAARPPRTRF